MFLFTCKLHSLSRIALHLGHWILNPCFPALRYLNACQKYRYCCLLFPCALELGTGELLHHVPCCCIRCFVNRVVAGSCFQGDFPSLHGLWHHLVVADSLQDHLLLSRSCLEAGGRICFQNEAAQLFFSSELITANAECLQPSLKA